MHVKVTVTEESFPQNHFMYGEESKKIISYNDVKTIPPETEGKGNSHMEIFRTAR